MPLPEPSDIDSGEVTFVNRFTLRGSPAEFEAAFARTSAFMSRQPGFRWHTLLAPDNRTDYMNIAVWRDEKSFRAAVTHPDFAEHTSALRAVSSSEPALYRPFLVRTAEEGTP